MNILLTSGGTRVQIDRVRHLGNMSNGTFGSRIARQILDQSNDRLTFLRAERSKSPFSMTVNWAERCAPFKGLSIPDPEDGLLELLRLRQFYNQHRERYEERTFKTFDDYVTVMENIVTRGNWGLPNLGPNFDTIVLAAAVSDFQVSNYVDGKIRSADAMSIALEPATKIISLIKQWSPKSVLVGFKLMVDSTDEQLIAAAQESAVKNDCAFVVANDLRDIQKGRHRILLVNKDGRYGEYQQGPNDPDFLASIVAEEILKVGRKNP
jgi:phosphopantothenate---cysteine ligase (CTP)